MQKVAPLISPVYHNAYLQWLYLHALQGEKQSELAEQLVLSPQYWRSHLYYNALNSPEAQAMQSSLQQQWLSQLTESQSSLYREWYID
jgi:eukaryotic-like serine/threonine-protein kinase